MGMPPFDDREIISMKRELQCMNTEIEDRLLCNTQLSWTFSFTIKIQSKNESFHTPV
jgi:hypothetical protein